MSTRVFNPYVMSGKRGGGHLDFGGSERRSPCDYGYVERAKRKLFGPVDHAEAKLLAERELEALQEKASQKWNFDFRTEKPRTSLDGYKWVKCTSTEEIPKAYDMQGCDYIHLHADIAGADVAEEPQNFPSSSSSTIKQCNKQSMITDFLKVAKRSNLSSTKSSSLSSVSEDEPAPKKARARSS